MAHKLSIRWMVSRDMRDVLDIERRSFEFPWAEEDFIRCLRQRNCIGMVAHDRDWNPKANIEWQGPVIGFMIYELHKTRLRVMNFAVDPECRRLGVGRQMMDKLLGKLSSQRRTRITLEVRESNLPAQLFFRQMGFKAVTVLRSYYEDCDEDAYLMQYRVEQPAALEAVR